MALSKVETETGVEDIFTSASSASELMEIAAEAIPHIINRLTDLYDDPIVATVRETISNAMDATKDGTPVEVSTPNPLDPYFKVRDHGVGMSPDTVREVFLKYGGSMKRDDLNTVGAFGLGAKAPLAYADSFKVETVHDGQKTLLDIQKDMTGPKFRMTVEDADGEPNGTLVIVPVSTYERFAAAVDSYRKFSMTQPIVIDGNLYDSNADYIEIGNVVIYRDEETGEETLGRTWVRAASVASLISRVLGEERGDLLATYVLSGFAYRPTNSDQYRYINSNIVADEIVVELKPGVVNFSSSRDNIKVDDDLSRMKNLVNAQLSEMSELWLSAYAGAITSSRSKTGDFLDQMSRVGFVPSIDARNSRLVFNLSDDTDSNNVFQGFLNISDFDDADGNNLVREVASSISDRPVKAVSIFGGGKAMSSIARLSDDDIGTPVNDSLLLTPSSRLISTDRVGEHKASLVALANTGFRTSILHAVYSTMSLNRFRVPNTLIFVTIANNDEIGRAVRQRANIYEGYGSHATFYLVADHESDDAEKESVENFVKTVAGVENVSTVFVDFDGYMDMAKANKPATDTKKADDSVDSFVIFSEGASRRDVVMNEAMKSPYWRRNSLADLMDEADPLFVAVPADGRYSFKDFKILDMLNGWLEARSDDALVGRKVIALLKPTKGVLEEIGFDDENLIFTPNFTHQSHEVERKAEDHSPARDVTLDRTVYMSDQEIVARYIINKVGNIPAMEAVKSIIGGIVANRPDITVFEDFLNIYEEDILDGKGRPRFVPEADVADYEIERRVSSERLNEIRMAASIGRVIYDHRRNGLSQALTLMSDSRAPGYVVDSCERWFVAEVSENLEKTF